MIKQLVGMAALAACIALPASLSAQSTNSVCKDGRTTTTVGSLACTKHGGIDESATAKMHARNAAEAKEGNKEDKAEEKAENKAKDQAEDKAGTKAATGVDRATNNTERAVATGAENTGKAVKKAASDVKDVVVGKDAAHTAEGAIAKCKDGTYSHAKEREDACTTNGGVESWLKVPTPE